MVNFATFLNDCYEIFRRHKRSIQGITRVKKSAFSLQIMQRHETHCYRKIIHRWDKNWQKWFSLITSARLQHISTCKHAHAQKQDLNLSILLWKWNIFPVVEILLFMEKLWTKAEALGILFFIMFIVSLLLIALAALCSQSSLEVALLTVFHVLSAIHLILNNTVLNVILLGVRVFTSVFVTGCQCWRGVWGSVVNVGMRDL